MIRRALIILAVSLFAPGLARAADSAPVKTFDSTFVQTRTLPGFKTPLVSHGVLRFDAAHGFHWEITSPYHYVFEMHDGQAHEELPDGTTRTLDPNQTPWLAAVQHIFVSALSGNRADLKHYFDISIEPLKKGRRITLVPKPGPMARAIVRITVTETAPGEPRRLEIEETSGAHMEIRFGSGTARAAP